MNEGDRPLGESRHEVHEAHVAVDGKVEQEGIAHEVTCGGGREDKERWRWGE
jgi:hypothetical protein